MPNQHTPTPGYALDAERGWKVCGDCGQQKPLSEFDPHSDGKGWDTYCHPCSRVRTTAWKLSHKEAVNRQAREHQAVLRADPEKRAAIQARQRESYRANPDRVWANNLRIKYGLTAAEYLVMMDAQGGVCALCGADEGAVHQRRLHVDHDHQTGRVRGLLCASCNLGIGMFERRGVPMPRLAVYLEGAHGQD